jgi:hypothetical protein
MRVLALVALAAMLAVPSYAQESASDDTDSETRTLDSLTGPAPTPAATESDEGPKDEWIDVLYTRSLGPYTSGETFRFDARDALTDRSWLSLELRWNVPSNFLNQRLARGGMGVTYERHRLKDARSKDGLEVASETVLHCVMLRQYFVRDPGRKLQRLFAIEAGVAFENSSQKTRDPATGWYPDLQERDRMMFKWGLAFGARFRPVRMAVLNGEVRVPVLVSRTITPGIQLTLGIGVSYD